MADTPASAPTPTPTSDSSTPAATGFWGKYKERQMRNKATNAARLRQRKQIDSKRRFITYKVWLTFWGLIMIWGIYNIWYPFKKAFLTPAPPLDYTPFSSLHDDSDDFLGFEDEDDGPAAFLPLSTNDVEQMKAIVKSFQGGLDKMKGSLKEPDSKIFVSTSNHMETFHNILNYTACLPECRSNSSYAVSKLLGHFGKAMSFLYNSTSLNSTVIDKTSVSPYAYAAHHFRKAIRASKQPQTQFPFVELNLNATFSSLVLDAHFKLSDVYRICHHSQASCPAAQVLNQKGSLLQTARKVLLDSSPFTNHTKRYSDHASLLRQLYEVSIELYDPVNASSYLDLFFLSSPEKELNATEKSSLLTNLCVFELQSSMYHEARHSCHRAIELAPSSNAAIVVAAEVEESLGNYTFVADFYERALKNANKENGDKDISSAELSFKLGSALALLKKDSQAEEYLKMAVGSHIRDKAPISPLAKGTPSYVHLAKHFLGTGRQDIAKDMFEKALFLNSQNMKKSQPLSWNYAIGLAYGASAAYNDAHSTYKRVIKDADELWNAGNYEDYKQLASVVHTLPSCPAVDDRLTDRSRLVQTLRKMNSSDVAIGKVRLLPEEINELEEYEKEDVEEKKEEKEGASVWDDDSEYDDNDDDDDDDDDDDAEHRSSQKLKTWVVKPRKGSRGGAFAGTKDYIQKVVKQQEHMKKHHFVAYEYPQNAFLTQKGGSPTSITAYTMLSNSWPLPRVYVHKLSVKINSSPNISFYQWTDDLTNGSSEDGLLAEANINFSGDTVYDEEEQDSLLKTMRSQNFNDVWSQSMRNIASCFEGSLKAEVRNFVKREKKSKLNEDMPLWRRYHVESGMCRQKTIYGVEMLLGHGNDERLGLLGKAKTRILDIESNVDIEASWGAQQNNTFWRTRDTLVMMIGDALDRSQLELVKNDYISPEGVKEKRLSNRLSWAIQKLTKELCPLLYKKKTEDNVAKKYDKQEKLNFEEFDCDRDKLGYFASELAIATMEYERKVGWVLAYPLKEAKPRKMKEGDDMLADGIIVRNLFVKWVREYEKEKQKNKGRESRG